jgi:hypothetical protein
MTDNATQDDTVTAKTGSITGLSRRTLLKAGAVTGSALALSSSVTAGAAQEDDDSPDNREDIRVPYLDLDTLETDFEGETLQAESYADWRPASTTYVGQVVGRSSPDLFAGVSLLADTAQSDEDGQAELVAYLCDGEPGAQDGFGILLSGDFDAGGATLTPETDEDAEGIKPIEDVEIKLALVDGEILGAATLPDGETHPFLAAEATGDAGMYRTELDPEQERFLQWVALPDGRQRGFEVCCLIIDGMLRCGPCVDLN